MKSCFFCVACLYFVFTAISGALGNCDPNTGPLGVTHCIGAISGYYRKPQCATCLTDTYIRLKTKGTHGCLRGTGTYCSYQCMLEMHELGRGPVYDDCLCDPSVQLPQPSVILPASCYSPNGTDCDWYGQCLAKMFHCTGDAEYAVNYGEKFCKLYEKLKWQFSQKALNWIDAARKCLQVALVPFLHLCQSQPTCEASEQRHLTPMLTATLSHTLLSRYAILHQKTGLTLPLQSKEYIRRPRM